MSRAPWLRVCQGDYWALRARGQDALPVCLEIASTSRPAIQSRMYGARVRNDHFEALQYRFLTYWPKAFSYNARPEPRIAEAPRFCLRQLAGARGSRPTGINYIGILRQRNLPDKHSVNGEC